MFTLFNYNLNYLYGEWEERFFFRGSNFVNAPKQNFKFYHFYSFIQTASLIIIKIKFLSSARIVVIQRITWYDCRVFALTICCSQCWSNSIRICVCSTVEIENPMPAILSTLKITHIIFFLFHFCFQKIIWKSDFVPHF